MKKLIAVTSIISILGFFNPAFAFTNSTTFALASSEYDVRADGANALDITTDWTFETWIKFTSLANSYDQVVMSKYDTGGNNRSYFFEIFDSDGGAGVTDTWQCGVSSDGITAVGLTKNVDITTGTWYHIACVYDMAAGSAEFFLNDVSQGSTGSGPTSIFSGTADFQISGLDTPASLYLDASVQLARLWATKRTAVQMAASNCVALGATASLVGEWAMDGNANDSSGNGFSLTETNTPAYTTDLPVSSTCSVGNDRKDVMLFE